MGWDTKEFGTFICGRVQLIYISLLNVHIGDYHIKSIRVAQEALAGETKRHVFQIACEMQRGLDLLRPNEGNKRERGHSFRVWRHSATKRKWRLSA